jgi:transposase-like protein
MKHKSEDFKLFAVKYYLKNNESMDIVCKSFDCKKSTLKDWIHKYKNNHKNLTRNNRKPISYKISKEQVDGAIDLLKHNEQISTQDLSLHMKEKFKDFDITPQHLGSVLRNNNKTRKRTRHQHFPKERRKVPTDKNKEMNEFYKEVNKYPLDKIITLDETSVGSLLHPNYSRCNLGKRCYLKTDDNFVFKKFTLLVAISNSNYVGYELYEKGGMTTERLLDFFTKYVFGKYKNHLIIMDNAKSHNNEAIKNAILKSGNNYLYSIPYTPHTNTTIESYFNQIKGYMKKKHNVNTFQKLEENVKDAIHKVKPSNYKNYFEYAYGIKDGAIYTRKTSTRKIKPKLYKD